jgi:Ser/Thr protein kinase RdoA (MazF antagonist)
MAKKKGFVVRKDGSVTRRKAALARRALAHYPLDVESLVPLATNQNWMFKLRTRDGRTFVVRVNRSGMRTPLDVASEIAWLAAIRRDTDLIVPDPLEDRSGGYVQVLEDDEGVEHPVSVFGWIEGRNVGNRIDTKLARQMGTAVGRLQEHADRFRPPSPFTTSTLDDVWAFGGRPDLHDHPWFPPERVARILRAAERGQARIDALLARKDEVRFLHIDLHMGNVRHVRGGQVAILDFDDSRWAHPVQDYSIPLFYLWHHEHGAELWDAYAEGYVSLRGAEPAPRNVLYDLIAARQIDLIAFVLKTDLLGAEATRSWLERADSRLQRLEALVLRSA